jgi:hypothetical protein
MALGHLHHGLFSWAVLSSACSSIYALPTDKLAFLVWCSIYAGILCTATLSFGLPNAAMGVDVGSGNVKSLLLNVSSFPINPLICDTSSSTLCRSFLLNLWGLALYTNNAISPLSTVY